MFFEIEKHQKQENDENEKDARRKMIAIRLINSSSTSVRNSNMKKTDDYKICGLSMHILQISMDYPGKTYRYYHFVFLSQKHFCVLSINNP